MNFYDSDFVRITYYTRTHTQTHTHDTQTLTQLTRLFTKNILTHLSFPPLFSFNNEQIFNT